MEALKYLFYVALLVVSLFFYVFRRRLSYWKDRGIPHDHPHIIYGNMVGIQTEKNFHEILREYYMKFKNSKPFVGFYMMASPDAMITDLDLIKNSYYACNMELSGVSKGRTVIRDTSQRGVISPLLWLLVVENLSNKQERPL
uniref:Cytochrome P450 n=1 Tax=Megaselia scalaris TaxID=36166 RepID=T1GTX2_MEGSC